LLRGFISNNAITGGTGNGNYGVWNLSSSPPIISNSTINGGSAGVTVVGLFGTGASTPSVRNNIVFTTGGTTRYCIQEGDTTSDPSVLQNNNLFDCPTAVYRDENTANMQNTCGPGGTGNTDSFHASPVGICTSSVNNGASPVDGNVSIPNTGATNWSIGAFESN
jgi:hypothetical protein